MPSVSAPPQRLLRLLPVLPLVALATACGGKETDEREFIAQSRAATLVRSVDRIEADLESGDCEQALSGVDRLRAQVGRLPDSYNGRLIANLTQWVDHLDSRVPQDCDAPEPDATATPEETVEPTPTPEETATPTPTPDETPEPDPTTTPVPIPSPDPDPPDTGGVPPGDDGA